MALLQIFEHTIGDRLQLRCAVLDRQAVDDTEDDVALLRLRLQEELQDALRLPGYIGADAITAADADYQGLNGRILNPAVIGLHAVDAFQLLLNEGGEVLLSAFDCLLVHVSLMFTNLLKGNRWRVGLVAAEGFEPPTKGL